MVLKDDSVLFVDGVEAARLLRISARIGAKVPAYSTAGGRALLAELSSEQLDELYPRLPKGAPPVPPSADRRPRRDPGHRVLRGRRRRRTQHHLGPVDRVRSGTRRDRSLDTEPAPGGGRLAEVAELLLATAQDAAADLPRAL